MDRTKVFLTIQTVICVLVVLMLSFGAIGVYKEGKAGKEADPSAHIYTREESVSAAVPGMIVAFLGIGVSVACLIMGIKDENADKPVNDTEISRDLITGRICKPSEAMKAEAQLQDKLKKGGWICFGVCMLPVFTYLVNPAHFDATDQAGLEHVIGSMVSHILPWIVIAFGGLIASTVYLEKSMKRESEAAAKRLKEEKEEGLGKRVSKKKEGIAPERLKMIRISVLALALIFIIAGIANGNMNAVMIKAINICTECVGLG